jgi:ribonuclease D
LPTEPIAAVPPPPYIEHGPDRVAARTDSLQSWRRSAARAAALLPAQICSDDDLLAIAAASPASPEELADLVSFGPVTAATLFGPIRAALDTADSSRR